MPRSLTMLAAGTTALPLTVALSSLLVASPSPSLTAAKLTATPALTASATPALATARLALSPTVARTALVAPARPTLAAARLSAVPALLTTPAFKLRHDSDRRRQAYIELCATDDQFGGPWHRSLSDALAWMECGVRPNLGTPFGPTPFDRVRDKVEEGCRHLDERSDGHPPDFDANDLIRLIYLYPPAAYVLATPTVNGASTTSSAGVLAARPASSLTIAALASTATTRAVPTTTTTPAITTTLASSGARTALVAAVPSVSSSSVLVARPLSSSVLLRSSSLVRAIVTPPAPPPPPKNRLTREIGGRIQTALKSWKYWIDEPGFSDQVYWSENHVILFATAEYLAGQLMPDAWFPNGGMRGRDHKAKARPRVLRWLDERLKFGFSEWNSPGYYEEDFKALFNLVDFCDDALIRKRASMVLDLMVFDLARYTNNGSFGVTAGRCYEKIGGDGSKWKSDGWRQSVGPLVEVLFGTRGSFNHSGSVGALYYATSRYQVPTVLLAIGQDRPDHFVDRSRVSLDFAEGPQWGIGTQGLDDGIFWWSKGAYMAKDTIATTRAIIRQHGVKRLREGIQDALGFAYGAFESVSDSTLRAASNAASPITEGMCLTKANIYTYRNRDVMLSSVQDYRRGQIGPQQHPWQATLGMKAVVFSTLPGKREGDGPGYWTGNAALPSIVQHEDALICAYDAPFITKVSEGLHRTHTWFPMAEFDETDRRRGSNLHGAWGVTSDGTWLFGRKGDGYIAVYSNEGYSSLNAVDQVSAGSWTNVFVVQVGNKGSYGDFVNFKNTVTRARIYVKYPTVLDGAFYCGYDIPGKGRLEMHYGGTPRLNGQPLDVRSFPRYDNPYCQLPWGGDDMTIRHAGFALRHVRDRDAQRPRGDVRTGNGF